MPLRCQDQVNRNIHAFDLDVGQWGRLRSENSVSKHLRMPCCDNRVVLKTSKRGTQFFAHLPKGPCTSKPESEEHLTIKSQVARALVMNGREVATEVRGQSRDGEDWTADVMAAKGAARFVIEIQWTA
jgi:competence CoiA-like predicted nuclease